MQRIANRAIEGIDIRTLEHHTEVVADGPVLFRSELLAHTLIKPGIGEWVRKGDADIVGTRLANESNRLLNVTPVLAGISELQEVAGAYPVAAEILARLQAD